MDDDKYRNGVGGGGAGSGILANFQQITVNSYSPYFLYHTWGWCSGFVNHRKNGKVTLPRGVGGAVHPHPIENYSPHKHELQGCVQCFGHTLIVGGSQF